jgi:hypothetical protein
VLAKLRSELLVLAADILLMLLILLLAKPKSSCASAATGVRRLRFSPMTFKERFDVKFFKIIIIRGKKQKTTQNLHIVGL